jgi:hypothetical protein
VVGRLWAGYNSILGYSSLPKIGIARMFQLFLRARVRNFIRSQSHNRKFKVRSTDRDAETDRVRIAAILGAIQTVLDDAEKEKLGFSRRVDDALAFAAVTMGTATDEYLERDTLNDHHQSLFNLEINGERRLGEARDHDLSFEIYQGSNVDTVFRLQAVGTK